MNTSDIQHLTQATKQKVKIIRDTPALTEVEKEEYCVKNEATFLAQMRGEELVDPKVTKTARRRFIKADEDRVAVSKELASLLMSTT